MVRVNLNSQLRLKAIRDNVRTTQKPKRKRGPRSHYSAVRQILREVLSDKQGDLLIRRCLLDKAAHHIAAIVHERIETTDQLCDKSC